MKKGKFRGFNQWAYLLMCLPGLIWMFAIQLIPMAGIAIAFEDYKPRKGIFGSKFVGLENFEYLFSLSEARRVIGNTIIIAVSKMVLNMIVPIIFALMLNELKNSRLKKSIQTITYLPHFVSWVIMSTILTNIFGYNNLFSRLVEFLGGTRQVWLGNPTFFRNLIIFSDVWKEFGFGAIIFISALAGIDNTLYEAAAIDGAGHFQRLYHVTLPGISTTIVLVGVLSLGNVLNAGFDQIYNMYNSLVMPTADIIDTWIYRMGLVKLDFSLSTAAGVVKSVISLALISVSYYSAYKVANYRIF